MHNSLEALHNHINKELLPTEYDGTAGPIEFIAADLPDKLMQRREWFVDDEQYKTDETKRPRKPKKAKSVRSLQNLDIDWNIVERYVLSAREESHMFKLLYW